MMMVIKGDQLVGVPRRSVVFGNIPDNQHSAADRIRLLRTANHRLKVKTPRTFEPVLVPQPHAVGTCEDDNVSLEDFFKPSGARALGAIVEMGAKAFHQQRRLGNN
jgi:hypothetical protein